MTTGHMGRKIRGIRRRAGLTQAKLAEQLGISSSYLNLIENNRRPLTAPLLIKLAELFDLELKSWSDGNENRLLAELLEVFGDPMFESYGLTNADIQELTQAVPSVAQALPVLYQAFRQTREALADIEGTLDDTGTLPYRALLPSEQVSDALQRNMNHFPDLEDAADELRKSTTLDRDRPDTFGLLVHELHRRHNVTVLLRPRDEMQGAVRRYSPDRGVLALSEVLLPQSRNFQLAHVIGLLSHSDLLDALVAQSQLSTEEANNLCRVALANYLAAAVLMPYDGVLSAARQERYDLEVLARRFGVGFEQICHRLTTLQRPGSRGVPFHLVRIDISGNISKRFSASGLHFARFSASCPLWNVHAAFHIPGQIRVQVSQMPDGGRFLCAARTVQRSSGSFNAPFALQSIAMGCAVEHARELVYSDGLDLDNPDTAVPTGITCRVCERTDCEQRAFPPLHNPLTVDENVRGISLYAPVK
ncbi:MAG: short-chain fatty acyl-CoA regulator family protein [Myxococcota bacterium]|nr:short-chain fatty acyl-CoA regulator family protein [Myxococcota bacterium]